MFPTASSQIDYNEDGEVLGWDSGYGFEPEYNDDDLSDRYGNDFQHTVENCEHDDIEHDASRKAYCVACEKMLPEFDY